MSADELKSDLRELSSAEDFLEHFRVDYEPRVVQVHRLHILQRFHDYLRAVDAMPEEQGARFEVQARLLRTAYQDFVDSSAAAEKVFKVFRSGGVPSAFVPVNRLVRRASREEP